MNFKKKIGRYLPLVILLVFLGLLVGVGIYSPDIANKYSNLLLVALTAIYAYFAFVLLRVTRLTKASPHLSLGLVFVSGFQTEFYKRYESSIDQNEEFLRVRRAADEGMTGRDYVFIYAENTGDSLAITPKIDLVFERKTAIEGQSEGRKVFDLPDLKAREKMARLLCVFDQASQNDFLQIRSVELSYGDIGGYNDEQSPSKHDMRANLGHFRDENVQVVLKD